MLSTLKDNSIKYPVMNLIAAGMGSRRIRNIVVSIYPIDNTRKEKRNGDPDYGPSCFFCAYNVGCFIKNSQI
jgi:hypothetical protein